ncbi:MAG: hypothetical protein R3F30_15725 [Planctomycetota bacterium]
MTRPPLHSLTSAVALVALLAQPLRAQGSQDLSLDAGLDRPALEQVMRRSAIAFPLDGSLEFSFRRRLGDRATTGAATGAGGAEPPARRKYVPRRSARRPAWSPSSPARAARPWWWPA